MKRFANYAQNMDSNMESRAPEMALHVMVLYDDLDAGILANDIHDRICARLPASTVARLSLWPFASLEDSNAERFAFSDLNKADVVIVAADGFRALPRSVRKTIEKRLTGLAPAHMGLAAILYRLNEDDKKLSPAHSYLESLARKAGADFFCQAIPSTAQETANAIRPLTVDFRLEDDSFSASVSIDHWGLNE